VRDNGLKGKGLGTQYNGFAAGNTRNLAAWGVLNRRSHRASPCSLTKVKSRVRPAVAQVPSLHPYFAALLEQLEDAKRRRVTILTPF
jgi:hypothetical protein